MLTGRESLSGGAGYGYLAVGTPIPRCAAKELQGDIFTLSVPDNENNEISMGGSPGDVREESVTQEKRMKGLENEL